ncbi:hypothetical protein DPMN_015312 [Dreissena polymorpha]|uniref:Uncharacterized protein n=1 Tax=Dreissena polymorpha TaxID=45954 RepID=A0A9D4NDE2_DREPO|nr:hypothetical protein DPMN_015312 [Dreissena polymorpha]
MCVLAVGGDSRRGMRMVAVGEGSSEEICVEAVSGGSSRGMWVVAVGEVVVKGLSW